ncbi:MAG: nucleotidyltransferase domain-containing protein [Anaerolineae bacterium]
MVLNENEQQALSEYRDFLLRRFPQQVERLVLFGSKARGGSGASSDIDVLVVLRKRTEPTKEGFCPFGSTDPTWREMVGTTFDLLMKYNVNISPTVIGINEFEEHSPLMTHIKKEGVELLRRTVGSPNDH